MKITGRIIEGFGFDECYSEDDNQLAIVIHKSVTTGHVNKILNILKSNTSYKNLSITNPDIIIKSLGDLLKDNEQYHEITLRGKISNEQICFLSPILLNPCVSYLALHFNQINDKHLDLLLESLNKRAHPIGLSLKGNNITDAGINELVTFMTKHPSTLNGLDLSDNPTTCKAYLLLTTVLNSSTLVSLSFGNQSSFSSKKDYGQSIDEQTVNILLSELKEKTPLRELRLGEIENKSNANKMIVSSALTHLSLVANRDLASLLKIFKPLQSTKTLTHLNLDLRHTYFTVDEVYDIGRFLLPMHNLTSLTILLDDIKAIVILELGDVLKKFKSLTEIKIDYTNANDWSDSTDFICHKITSLIVERNKVFRNQYDELQTLLGAIEKLSYEKEKSLNLMLETQTLFVKATTIAENLLKSKYLGITEIVERCYLEHARFLFSFNDGVKMGLEKLQQVKTNYLEKMKLIFNCENPLFSQLNKEKMLLALAHSPFELVEEKENDETNNLVKKLMLEIMGQKDNFTTKNRLTLQKIRKKNPERYDEIVLQIKAIRNKSPDEIVKWLEDKKQKAYISSSPSKESLAEWVRKQGIAGSSKKHFQEIGEQDDKETKKAKLSQ